MLRPVSFLLAPLRVGVVIPLTGKFADYGIGIQSAIELARETEPELFKDVTFNFEDAESDTKKAVQAFQKLRSTDRVDLMYTWGVAFCQALAPLAEQSHVPTVGQCIDPSAEKGHHWFIRFQNSTDGYMDLQLRYLREASKTNLAIVVADHPYTEALLEALERLLPILISVPSSQS